MFLKRLELVGFKSFAERISVDFVPGVTAVVGPNGSGKSNITDAIRWVLGEQSAKSLRGGKMEDIIFAGSDTRKPLNFAEVSLTLENEDHFLPIDYNEVCIIRRMYRSGESEYFINKQPCRLKDIVDLLMDTGFGRDSFSIISQGKVEEILNSKSEERRTIFEEAAGVLKYKTRKKKAEVKLKETEENLNRVRDIIHELEAQEEPLKIQASMAKDYLQKKDELQQYEISLLVYEIEQLHEKWEKQKKQLEENKDKELELSTQLQSKEANVTRLRDQMTALDESIDQLQHLLLITSEELEKLEGKREVLKERKKNAGQIRTQLKQAIDEGEQKLIALDQEIAILEQQKNETSTRLNEEKEKLKDLQKLLAAYSVDVEEKIESLKSDYIELLNKQAAIKNDHRHITQQLEQLKLKQERLRNDNHKYIAERNEILFKKGELEKQLANLEKQIDLTAGQFRDERNQLEQLTRQYEKVEKTYYQALQYVQQAKSRKELLEEMEEDYSGFYQGVKEILKAKDQLQGIEGAVAELIKVKKSFQVALDVALSSSQQYIVVQTEEHARQAIKFLKAHGYGRATFLPLSVIQPKELPKNMRERLETHPSYIGIAAELLDYDQKYQNIIHNLLGNVIISKDLRGANDLAALSGHRYRIVTLEGDVVNPGGSMTGGSLKKNTGSLLSRKLELDTLKQKLVEMENQCTKLEKDVKVKKHLMKEKEEKLQTIQKTGETLRQQELQLKDQLKEIQWNEKNIQERLTLFDTEDAAYDEEISGLLDKKAANEKVFEEINAKIAETDQLINELSEKRNLDQSKKTDITEEINNLKVNIAKMEEQLHHVLNQLRTNKERHEEIHNQLKNNQEDLSLLMKEMETDHSGENKIAEEAKRKAMEKNKTIELIAERRKQRLEFQQALEDLEQEVKELKRQHKGLTQSLTDEEVKLNRMDVDLENRLTTLSEEYMLTFERAKEQYPMTVAYEEAKKKVKLIKLAIDELGTVNLGAIDEYERISERLKFLTEQRDDLLSAKNTLFQVIEEMDDEMIKRFSETFTAIKSQFDSVFKSLFGGGRAELKLTMPDDLLNTGVDIIAQPPGKKLQNLGLLSGGERALTAIALLFSILKVRPVPFCILDEVEAALDEANVYRFAQYLKHFSSETQFIVITHRKGTMEEADVLYGVTMQESGVSKLVSVRLEDTANVG